MNATRLPALLAIAAALACSGNDRTAPGGTVGSFGGVTRSAATGDPVAGAVVVIAGLAGEAGSDGRFQIDSVPAGRQPVSAARGGYLTLVDSVSIEPGVMATLTLALVPGAAPPPPPPGVSAAVGDAPGSVRVTWQAVAGAESYTVYWGTSPGVTPATGESVGNASNPFVHTGLSAGTTYYYIVTATGPDGESEPSAEVSAGPEGNIAVRLFAPAGSGLVDSAFQVIAGVTSVSQIASVTAQVGSINAPLAFDLNLGRWTGTVPLGGLPSPSVQHLTVTATDVQGASAQISVPVRYDRPPAVTLALPAPGAVATPSTRIVATCTDDGATGCSDFTISAFTISHDRVVLLTGSNHVDQMLSLAGFDGQALELRADGTDGSQQHSLVARLVYVDGSPHLTPVATAGAGTLVDADATRLLVLDSLGTTDTLRIVDRGSSLSSVVTTHADSLILFAALTPPGALFLTSSPLGVFQPTLAEWRGGTVSIVSSAQNFTGLIVKNGFALWNTGDFHTPILIRRDLAAGTNVTVANNAGNTENDIAPNGDVVYWSNDLDIFSYHAGATTQLTSDGMATFDIYPATDGVHVVYVKRSGVNAPSSIVLSDPAGDLVLASNLNFPDPERNYKATGGWIAFTRPDQTGTLQVWIRSPASVETQVSSLGSNSLVDLLSPSGEVVFTSQATGAVRRYRAAPGGPPADIGSGLGRPLYIGGQLHVLLGATLFRVD